MFRKVLITAGNTKVPIDQVRRIDNIFSGRTGTEIAKYFAEHGEEVTLLTSDPSLLNGYHKAPIRIVAYKMFDQLERAMKREITEKRYDLIIHSSAVSDHIVDKVYIEVDDRLVEIDRSKKISSKHKHLFLRTSQTPKLIDFIRDEWGFKKTLVKFKLEVGISDEELINIAKESRDHSRADFIIANTLESMGAKAFIIDKENRISLASRKTLPEEMFKRIA